jgi:hypothetical protein
MCTDIDECTEQFTGCQQTCDNNDGGFTCGCGYGYELLPDGKCNQSKQTKMRTSLKTIGKTFIVSFLFQ